MNTRETLMDMKTTIVSNAKQFATIGELVLLLIQFARILKNSRSLAM